MATGFLGTLLSSLRSWVTGGVADLWSSASNGSSALSSTSPRLFKQTSLFFSTSALHLLPFGSLSRFALGTLSHDHPRATNYLLRGSRLGWRRCWSRGRTTIAIGGGRATTSKKVGHRSVFFDKVRRKRIGLAKCFLKGPKDGALGLLGEAKEGVRRLVLGRGRKALVTVEIRQDSGGLFVVVTEILGELSSKGTEYLFGLTKAVASTGKREYRRWDSSTGGCLKVRSALGLGRSWTGSSREARSATESPV